MGATDRVSGDLVCTDEVGLAARWCLDVSNEWVLRRGSACRGRDEWSA